MICITHHGMLHTLGIYFLFLVGGRFGDGLLRGGLSRGLLLGGDFLSEGRFGGGLFGEGLLGAPLEGLLFGGGLLGGGLLDWGFFGGVLLGAGFFRGESVGGGEGGSGGEGGGEGGSGVWPSSDLQIKTKAMSSPCTALLCTRNMCGKLLRRQEQMKRRDGTLLLQNTYQRTGGAMFVRRALHVHELFQRAGLDKVPTQMVVVQISFEAQLVAQ